MRYVAHIARVYLFVSVGNGGILLCRVFQLKNTKGYAVDVEKHIGDADIIFESVAHFELIDKRGRSSAPGGRNQRA